MTSRYDPQRHHRRSIRLPGWDYAAAGAYSVTVCAHQRLCLFGNVVAGSMHPNTYGRLIDNVWRRNPVSSRVIRLDILQVMPNHLHAIMIIEDTDQMLGATPVGPQSGRLGTIVGNLKSVCTRRINGIRHVRGETIWQRNYWEPIIRDEDEYDRIRHDIATNPMHWAEDQLYAPAPEGEHHD